MLNSTITASASSRPESVTDTCQPRQFSPTCVSSWSPVQPNNTEELRTWLAQAFRAPRSHTQDCAEEVMTPEICGLQQPQPFAQLDPKSHGWKMSLALFPLDTSPPFSETWPKWGLMRNGVAYQRGGAERPMPVRESGYLPTPTAHNAKEGNYPAERTRNTPTLASVAGGKLNPEWTEWLMGWPMGWTDLKPLATARFQQWLSAHGSYSHEMG